MYTQAMDLAPKDERTALRSIEDAQREEHFEARIAPGDFI